MKKRRVEHSFIVWIFTVNYNSLTAMLGEWALGAGPLRAKFASLFTLTSSNVSQ